MLIIGLTGSIASGKSFALQAFASLRLQTHSADEVVHKILVADAKLKQQIFLRFPNTKDANNNVIRSKLAQHVYKDSAEDSDKNTDKDSDKNSDKNPCESPCENPTQKQNNIQPNLQHTSQHNLQPDYSRADSNLKWLEQLIHPRVSLYRKKFLQHCRRIGARTVVIEIPLLLETAAQKEFDYIVMTFAPKFLRRQRAFKRKAMNSLQWRNINQRQMHDYKKKTKCDRVIISGLGKATGRRSVIKSLCRIRNDHLQKVNTNNKLSNSRKTNI